MLQFSRLVLSNQSAFFSKALLKVVYDIGSWLFLARAKRLHVACLFLNGPTPASFPFNFRFFKQHFGDVSAGFELESSE